MPVPNPAAKARLLAQVAGRTAEAAQHHAKGDEVLVERDADGLRAKAAGATYAELQAATGLSRVGVYKMLERANGGPLSGVAQDDGAPATVGT